MRFAIFLVFLLMGVTTSAHAQGTKNQEVTVAVKKFTKAMLDGDTAVLSKMTTPNITYGHSSGKVQHKKDFLESFSTGATDFVTIDIQDQTIDFTHNTAIVRHLFTATTNDNQQPGQVTLKIMTVWVKLGKEWKLTGRQAVKAL